MAQSPVPSALNVSVGNSDALMQLHRTLTEMGRQLMVLKNADYSPGDDPFINFHDAGAYGILTRLGDKYHRLLGLEKRRMSDSDAKFQVSEEGVVGTAIDLINYSVLYIGYLHRERKPR